MKCRIDYVSNSSSCSFVVAHTGTARQLVYDACQAANCLEDIVTMANYFKGHTCLNLITMVVDLKDPCGIDEHVDGMIPANFCIPNKHLAKYFDKNGDVRRDLNVPETLKSLMWYIYSTQKRCWEYNENVMRRWCVPGRVNEKTVKFTRWLIQHMRDYYGYVYLNLDDRANDSIVEEHLKENQKCYVMRFNYQGETPKMNPGSIRFNRDMSPGTDIGTIISEEVPGIRLTLKEIVD